MPIPGGGAYGWPPTLDEAKAQLGASDVTYDSELQGFIDAAVDEVENVIGPVTPTSYTDFLDGGGQTVVLNHYPVVSVSSVLEYDSTGTGTALTSEPLGGTYDGNGYILDADIGVLRRMTSGSQAWFLTGTANIAVTYIAGRSTVPAGVRLATLLILEHLWEQSQRGDSSGRPVPAADVDADVYSGPDRYTQAMALLDRYRKAPHV